jgi:AraC-type DNA-binding domain-containing proteins
VEIQVYLAESHRFAPFSSYYLARCLKKYTGMSPLQYLHHLQVKRAKSLLENTGLSVAEIGRQVGIDNVNYFIRMFRKQTGMTPGQYRTARLYGIPYSTP